jgi:CheY-like chemotaxis protein
LKLELAAGSLDEITTSTVCSTSSGIVLVVDDDPDIRDALCELLEGEGYRAASASNGQEALTYLNSKEPPCVILLDLMMPIMDGWEFRRQQQIDPRLSKIPVVVITAAGKYGADSITADRILPKPLQLEQVLEALHQYC